MKFNYFSLKLYFNLTLKLLILVLSIFFGFYPFLSFICDIFEFNNPTLIFNDTSSIDTDLVSSTNNPDIEEISDNNPFYKKTAFWISVGIICILVVGGVYYFYGTSSSPDFPKSNPEPINIQDNQLSTTIPLPPSPESTSSSDLPQIQVNLVDTPVSNNSSELPRIFEDDPIYTSPAPLTNTIILEASASSSNSSLITDSAPPGHSPIGYTAGYDDISRAASSPTRSEMLEYGKQIEIEHIKAHIGDPADPHYGYGSTEFNY